MVFYSMKAIQDKWPVHSGRIRVRILGEEKDLPTDLQAIVEATGPDKCIEGSVLVDLCMQRSGRRESGCDAPKTSEELSTPIASPPRTPTPPAAQVRQYSWWHYAKKEVCLYIHTLKPLKAHQKSQRESLQYSVIRDNAERSNSELNQLVHVPQYENNTHTLKPLKTRKEEGNLKFKCAGSTNCQNSSDVNVNKPVVARERYAAKKHSLVSKKGFLKSTLSVCSQTFTKVALMLAVVISILGGVLNVKLPGRRSTIGSSSSVCQECEFANSSNSVHPLSFAILQESTAAVINLSKGLCSRMSKVMFLTGNKQLAGSIKMLQNTLRPGVTIVSRCSQSNEFARPRTTTRSQGYSTRSEPTLTRNVLAGKRLDTHIFPSSDFWVSRVYYFDTYTVNL